MRVGIMHRDRPHGMLAQAPAAGDHDLELIGLMEVRQDGRVRLLLDEERRRARPSVLRLGTNERAPPINGPGAEDMAPPLLERPATGRARGWARVGPEV